MASNEPISAEPLGEESTTGSPWAEAGHRLQEAETYWVATVRPDGRPHVTPTMGLWLDGAFYFSASETSRKAANLGQNSHCVVTVSTLGPPPIDLIVEGHAEKVHDTTKLHRVADAYAAKYGWEVTVRDGGFYGESAPTAGPPPYAILEVVPTIAFGFPGIAETDEHGRRERSLSPTRWRF